MTFTETPSPGMEPIFPDAARGDLLDLLSELPTAASRLTGRIHPQTAASLANLVRVMNCYYSNLIEGHNTRPRDIERALNADFNSDGATRDLQLEARNHIALQSWIDQIHTAPNPPDPANGEFLKLLHRQFYLDAPDDMLWIKNEHEEKRFKMVPGEFRQQAEQDVVVGRHVPPTGSVVTTFMDYFSQRYSFARLRQGQRLLALGAAHHRLNWIHPFPDGNGRVSRLMSHAMAHQAGLGAHGLWSISRGLARGLPDYPLGYKAMMMHADMRRQGDLDGRGNLSEKALGEFCTWFLKVCLDQINFMAGLFELDNLGVRLKRYAHERGWRPEAALLLIEIMHRGEIERGQAETITGLGQRTARTLLTELVADGILGSATPKGPVSLRFPIKTQDILFPQLYPAQVG